MEDERNCVGGFVNISEWTWATLRELLKTGFYSSTERKAADVDKRSCVACFCDVFV